MGVTFECCGWCCGVTSAISIAFLSAMLSLLNMKYSGIRLEQDEFEPAAHGTRGAIFIWIGTLVLSMGSLGYSFYRNRHIPLIPSLNDNAFVRLDSSTDLYE
eukprot:150729_1